MQQMLGGVANRRPGRAPPLGSPAARGRLNRGTWTKGVNVGSLTERWDGLVGGHMAPGASVLTSKERRREPAAASRLCHEGVTYGYEVGRGPLLSGGMPHSMPGS